MFYAGAFWFVLLVMIGLLILRTPDFREITITIAGALLPWMVLYAVWYLTGRELVRPYGDHRHNLFDRVCFGLLEPDSDYSADCYCSLVASGSWRSAQGDADKEDKVTKDI